MKGLHRSTRLFCASRAGRCHRAKGGIVALGIALCAAGSSDAAADENATAPSADANALAPTAATVLGDDELLIREVFTSHLPLTLKKYALRLWVHPHLDDFINNDHLRLSTGVRYGLTAKCEISSSSDLYFSHGFGNVRAFDRYGAANLQLGMKINLGQPVFSGWDTAIGADYVFPTGRPPAELTDGLRHFMPYVTFSHRLSRRRGARVFWGLRLDEVTHTTVPGEFSTNALKDNSTGVTGGFVIDRKNWHYTFETSFDTTRSIGHSRADVFMIRPGVIWEVPSRRHPRTRSNWVVGGSVRSSFGPGGTVVGGSLKLRYNLDLKNRFRHTVLDQTP